MRIQPVQHATADSQPRRYIPTAPARQVAHHAAPNTPGAPLASQEARFFPVLAQLLSQTAAPEGIISTHAPAALTLRYQAADALDVVRVSPFEPLSMRI